MSSNEQILRGLNDLGFIEKRADADSTILTTGGALPTEVESEFLRIAQNATPLMEACRQVTMGAKQHKIPKLIFEDDVLRADPGEGTQLGSGDRAAPTATDVTLNSKVVMAEVKLTDELLEDNVEREGFRTTILTLLAQRVGINVEKMALLSDTTIVDATLVANGFAQQNGWLKLITSNVVNFSSADLTRAKLNAMLTSIALKFRQRPGYVYALEEYAGETWRGIIGDRATALGDSAVTGEALPVCNGKKVIQVPNMPVTAGTPNVSSALLTDPKNLVIGWQRGIRMEYDRRPRERATYLVCTMRLAFAVEHEPAACKGTNVKAR